MVFFGPVRSFTENLPTLGLCQDMSRLGIESPGFTWLHALSNSHQMPPSCCCLKESTKKGDICPRAWSKFANFSPRLRVKKRCPFLSGLLGFWPIRNLAPWPLPSDENDAGGSSCRSNLPLGKPVKHGKPLSEQT